MFDRFKNLRFEHIRQKSTPNNKNFGGGYYLGGGTVFFIRGKGLEPFIETSTTPAHTAPTQCKARISSG